MDLLGWDWEYEPFDLDGYIPDFQLTGFDGTPILEVKPAVRVSELEESVPKIKASGWAGDWLIVGATQWTVSPPKWGKSPGIGSFGEVWSQAVFAYCRRCEAFSIAFLVLGTTWGCSRCRSQGEFSPGDLLDEDDWAWRTYWKDAGNEVQWRKAKKC